MPSTLTSLPAVDRILQGHDSTDRRIAVERTRRKVFIPLHARLTRRIIGGLLVLADILVLLSAILIKFGLQVPHLGAPLGLSLFALMGPALLAVYIAGAYRLDAVLRNLKLKAVAVAACGGFFIGLLCYKILYAVMANQPVIRYTVAGLIAAPLFALWIVASRWCLRRLLSRMEARSKLLFLGSRALADETRLALRKQGNTNPLVVFDDNVPDSPSGSRAEDPALAPTKKFDSYLAGAVKGIVLACPLNQLSNQTIHDLVHARLLNIPIISPSVLFEELWERTPITMDDHGWFLQQDQVLPSRSLTYQGAKRLFDLTVASVGLIVTAPIMLLVTIAVRATSPGPALFRQTRVGLWKDPFTIYKFRTMRTDAEKHGAQWACKNDPRVTPIGGFLRKTRLDELPQLWNVLTGSMSIVGPRPERPEFNAKLESTIPYYDLRHLVKPGITGWAQVRYPYGASVEDAIAKLEYEIYYIKNASMRFDLRIAMRTLGTLIGLRGR